MIPVSMPRFLLAILLLCWVFCVCPRAAAQQKAPPGTRGDRPDPVHRASGWVDGAPLADFAPPRLAPAFAALGAKRAADAAPKLEAEVRAHPDDVAAWVGLMQCRPEEWARDCDSLEKDVARSPRDTESRFKLGVLIYYRWARCDYKIEPVNSPRTAVGNPAKSEDEAAAVRAAALIREAWTRDHKPVYGMMLLEAGLYLRGLGPEGPVIDRMIHDLAGEAAYRSYKDAAADAWRGDPPRAQSVQQANRAPLAEVVSVIWGPLIMRGGTMVMVNGAWTIPPPNPLPPAKAAEAAYLDRWIKSLKAARETDTPKK